MGKLRKGWDWLNHAFTLQALVKLVLPLVGVGALAAYLAYLTTFLRMFAPLSYLLTAFIAIILAALALNGVAGLAKQLGWSPKPHEPRKPRRDAELLDVAKYIVTDDFGIRKFAGDPKNVSTKAVEKEMMDRIGEEEIAIWGRIGHWQTRSLGGYDWDHCSIDLRNEQVRMTSEWGSAEYSDIQLNWRQVRNTWPKPPFWRRMMAIWSEKQSKAALPDS